MAGRSWYFRILRPEACDDKLPDMPKQTSIQSFEEVRSGSLRKSVKLRQLLQLAAGLLVAVLGLALSVPHAVAAPSDAQVKAALYRIGGGTWKHEDLQLIRAIPELAAHVIDPTAEVTERSSEVLESQALQSPAAVASINCKVVNHDLTYYTLDGSVGYTWRNSARFCADNSNWEITAIDTRYDSLLVQDGVRYVRQRTVDMQGGVGTGSAYSHIQREIEACLVNYGCYGVTYPWSKITISGSLAFLSLTGSAG